MASKNISLILLLSLFLLSTCTIAFSSKRDDPEKRLEQCRERCSGRRQQQQQQCEQRCQEKYQQEKSQQGEEEGQDGKSRKSQDPKQRLEECRQQCRQQEEEVEEETQQQEQQCEQKCRRQYEEERREQKEDSSSSSRSSGEEKEDNNPYVFEQESFIHRAKNQHGSIRVLKNFLRRSKLLMGIANYRLVIFEANPRTFAMPKHSDADEVFFVVKGGGVITLLRSEENSVEIRKESHRIRKGDIIRVQSGTVVYIVNDSNNKKLRIAKLVQPVSTPGQFQDFYTVGGRNPQSILRTFSDRILQAALNTEQDKLERIFGRQDEGVIVQASEEQIKGLSRQTSSEGGSWPFGGRSSSSRTFNLLQKRPDHSNKHGKLFVADSDDYEQLKDLNLHVTFSNVTSGSMVAPFFESEATKIAVVVEGDGEFEMVCPHLSSSSQGQQKEGEEESESESEEQGQKIRNVQYQKIRSRVSQGTVFVIPAGHPTAIVASRNSNLQVVCFEVNAKDSRKVFLAGKNNVVNQMDREAKELAFGVPSRLVDEVFGQSKHDVFVRGPEQDQQREEEEKERRGGSRPLSSILEFVNA